MTAFRCLLIFLALTLAGVAVAGQCVVRSRAAVVSTNVVAATAAVVATPLVATVPAYGAAYDASATEIPGLKEKLAAHEARLKLVEDSRDQALRRLAVIEAKLGLPLPPVTPPRAEGPAAAQQAAADGLPAAVARGCVQCHKAGANPKGGFALVDATGKSLLALTCEQRLDVLRRINLQETDPEVMPPKGKGAVSDQEAAELLDAMTKLPKK